MNPSIRASRKRCDPGSWTSPGYDVIPFWEEEAALEGQLQQVTDLILELIQDANDYISSYLRSMVESQGKMLRPALVMIGSRLGNDQDESRAVRQAALLEMIHLASLVHDDIIDDADMRRGIPSLQKQLGVRRAVVAGDYLLVRAISLLTDKGRTLDPAVMSHAIGRLCTSEIDQDSEEWDFFITPTHYLRRIAGKTATLFALSAYSGAFISDAEPLVQRRMHEFGYCLGMAFQIRDDILDLKGTKASMGKPVGKDITSGVATLPLIYALERDETGSLQRLLQGKRKFSKRKVGLIINRILDSGALAAAESLSEKYLNRAQALLGELPDQETAKILSRMIERLVSRVS